MASQVMRITLKAYEHGLVDESAAKIVENCKKTGSQLTEIGDARRCFRRHQDEKQIILV